MSIANKKRLVLNIAFFIVIVLTIIFYTNQYFYYKNELGTVRKMYGDGYYLAELFMLMVPWLLLITIMMEAGIYFSLKYFIISDKKTTVKTVFNIFMLMIEAFSIYFLFFSCI